MTCSSSTAPISGARSPLRIIGGQFRGRVIKGTARPSTALLREALFNCIGSEAEGAIVLDLFSGSGALGLEAMSRGAKEALFIEKDPRILRQNLALFPNINARVIRGDCLKVLGSLKIQADLILADPPYELDLRDQLLQIIEENDLLRVGGALFIEEASGRADGMHQLRLVKRRIYGKSTLLEYRHEEGTISGDL